jgi:1-acyl-sn-glycerol-3-phosphate acyltransferase
MSVDAIDNEEIASWDRSFAKQISRAVRPIVKKWFRAEVRGLESFPRAGGALVVSNHSGGMLTPDVFIFSSAFYKKFGFDRPLYTLAHYGVFIGPLSGWLRRLGVIYASRRTQRRCCALEQLFWFFLVGTMTRTGRR